MIRASPFTIRSVVAPPTTTLVPKVETPVTLRWSNDGVSDNVTVAPYPDPVATILFPVKSIDNI